MAILPIFIPHAGCPHQCVFCNQRTISGQKTAALPGAKAQIQRWLQWLRPSKANEAAFYGGSFTGLDMDLQKQLLALTDELLEQGIIGSVRLSTRPDYINAEVLSLLGEHGVELVELGVQSLDDAVLQRAERGHTVEAVYAAHKLLKEYGFKTGIQLMVGMPGQDFASVQDTAAKVAQLRPDIARIYPLLVIKDTPLAHSYEQGAFVPLSLEEAVEQSAYLYKTLTQAGIKVIRIGLQPDEELCEPGNIIAGPFHPSMGELVKSRVLRNHFTPILQELVQGGAKGVLFHCPRKMESKLRGLKNSNMQYWQQQFPALEIHLMPSSGEGINLCLMGSACGLVK
ncbi:MAG: radical SAM protein [Phascolarctobacterium sp.]|nr:radical SAM protein [Phascolarctobacterium sp.]